MIGLSPLPPAHPSTFQRKPVRPSSACHGAFSLARGRSQSFASAAGDCRPVRTRLRSGCAPQGARPRRRRATRRLIMQKARRHPKRGSDRLQAHGFRFCFTPLPAVLFTFPSRYSSTIGLPGVLSLGGWCRQIRTGFLRPRPTQGTGSVGERFTYGAVTLSGPPFQAGSATLASSLSPALLPRCRLDGTGLGSSPFARRYSGSHCCFPFLRLLRCFSSSGWPPTWWDGAPPARRVAPFGHPRIQGRSRLPADFRSLPRPSSPPGAQASSVRPCHTCASPRPSAASRRPDLSCARLSYKSYFKLWSAFLPSCQ